MEKNSLSLVKIVKSAEVSLVNIGESDRSSHIDEASTSCMVDPELVQIC